MIYCIHHTVRRWYVRSHVPTRPLLGCRTARWTRSRSVDASSAAQLHVRSSAAVFAALSGFVRRFFPTATAGVVRRWRSVRRQFTGRQRFDVFREPAETRQGRHLRVNFDSFVVFIFLSAFFEGQGVLFSTLSKGSWEEILWEILSSWNISSAGNWIMHVPLFCYYALCM